MKSVNTCGRVESDVSSPEPDLLIWSDLLSEGRHLSCRDLQVAQLSAPYIQGDQGDQGAMKVLVRYERCSVEEVLSFQAWSDQAWTTAYEWEDES